MALLGQCLKLMLFSLTTFSSVNMQTSASCHDIVPSTSIFAWAKNVMSWNDHIINIWPFNT